jgi:hypothetical protein
LRGDPSLKVKIESSLSAAIPAATDRGDGHARSQWLPVLRGEGDNMENQGSGTTSLAIIVEQRPVSLSCFARVQHTRN